MHTDKHATSIRISGMKVMISRRKLPGTVRNEIQGLEKVNVAKINPLSENNGNGLTGARDITKEHQIVATVKDLIAVNDILKVPGVIVVLFKYGYLLGQTYTEILKKGEQWPGRKLQ